MTQQSPHTANEIASVPIGNFTATRIREADFPAAPYGYDKTAVRAYLDEIAEEVAALHHAVSIARNETARHHNALWHWQSQHTGTRHDPPLEPAPPAATAASGTGHHALTVAYLPPPSAEHHAGPEHLQPPPSQGTH